MIKVVHIITGLDTGGAQAVLYRLIASVEDPSVKFEVISLTGNGAIGPKLMKLGVRVRTLDMHRLLPNPLKVLTLVKWLRESRPDVVQTWMYHADLLGGVSAKLAGGIPTVWGIHHFNIGRHYNKRRTVGVAKLCAKFSRWLPARVVACSKATCISHIELGYFPDKMVVIPNGIDTHMFRPNLLARKNIRRELRIPADVSLIGKVARIDLQKDHCNFVAAAKRLRGDRSDVHFLLCGEGVTWHNPELVGWIDNAGLRGCFHLLGVRADIADVTASLDIATLSSFGESFSLAIGEAMACGIPCVTTDIVAPVELLGGHGWVVPIHDSVALCQAWGEILDLPNSVLKKRTDAGLMRINRSFSIEEMALNYMGLFKKVAIGS